jgi:hypothetical protein
MSQKNLRLLKASFLMYLVSHADAYANPPTPPSPPPPPPPPAISKAPSARTASIINNGPVDISQVKLKKAEPVTHQRELTGSESLLQELLNVANKNNSSQDKRIDEKLEQEKIAAKKAQEEFLNNMTPKERTKWLQEQHSIEISKKEEEKKIIAKNKAEALRKAEERDKRGQDNTSNEDLARGKEASRKFPVVQPASEEDLRLFREEQRLKNQPISRSYEDSATNPPPPPPPPPPGGNGKKFISNASAKPRPIIINKQDSKEAQRGITLGIEQFIKSGQKLKSAQQESNLTPKAIADQLKENLPKLRSQKAVNTGKSLNSSKITSNPILPTISFNQPTTNNSMPGKAGNATKPETLSNNNEKRQPLAQLNSNIPVISKIQPYNSENVTDTSKAIIPVQPSNFNSKQQALKSSATLEQVTYNPTTNVGSEDNTSKAIIPVQPSTFNSEQQPLKSSATLEQVTYNPTTNARSEDNTSKAIIPVQPSNFNSKQQALKSSATLEQVTYNPTTNARSEDNTSKAIIPVQPSTFNSEQQPLKSSATLELPSVKNKSSTKKASLQNKCYSANYNSPIDLIGVNEGKLRDNNKPLNIQEVIKGVSTLLPSIDSLALTDNFKLRLNPGTMHYTNSLERVNEIGGAAGEGGSSPFNIFAHGFTGISKQKSIDNMSEIKLRYNGGIIGGDTFIGEYNIFGITYSHTKLTNKLSSNRLKGNIAQSHNVNVYWENYLSDSLYLSSQIGCGIISIKATGKSGLNARGHTLSIGEQVGYIIKSKNDFLIIPTIGVSFKQLKLFKANIQDEKAVYKSTNLKQQRVDSDASVAIAKILALGNITFIPSLNVGVETALSNKSSLVKISSIDSTLHSIVPQDRIAKTTYNVGGGIKVSEARGEVSFHYDMLIRKGFKSHTGALKIKINI